MFKNYKLFGKINIIDLFVLLVVVAAVLFVGTKFLGNDGGGELSNVRLTFYSDETSDFVIDKIAEGAPIFDDSHKVELGTCEYYAKGDTAKSSFVEDGVWHVSDKPDYSTLELVCLSKGVDLPNGVEIGGEQYCVGDYIVLRIGHAKIYIELIDISVE